jgi:hypothetical protein
MHDGYLIIDDVTPALAMMSVLGREIASPAADDVRTAIVEASAKRGWLVVDHSLFASWATDELTTDARPWLVLDPLLDVAPFTPRVRACRISRPLGNGTPLLTPPVLANCESIDWSAFLGQSIGMVDDAITTGRTVSRMLGETSQRGVIAGRMLVCAASRPACDMLRARAPSLQLRAYVPGDWNTLHLRDICPYLPYSGRLASTLAVQGTGGTSVEVRVPSDLVPGHLWSAICVERGIACTVRGARARCARLFRTALGREPTIRDLLGLGPASPVHARFGASHGASPFFAWDAV